MTSYVKDKTEGAKTKGSVAHCETNVRNMHKTTMVAVIRDISERIARFEAEKQLAVESTERETKLTNRFTRHEVKNGLLSAIGLCDALKERTGINGTENYASNAVTHPCRTILELEVMLNEVLDTVFSEAMSRDVIQEKYDPREEVVDIRRLLDATRHDLKRFPAVSSPVKLPRFFLDPQLFRFVHRNAVSNACKYGQPGGVVSTYINYDTGHKLLTVDIVNEPGVYHERLVELGETATTRVFEPGQRLYGAFGVFIGRWGLDHAQVRSNSWRRRCH